MTKSPLTLAIAFCLACIGRAYAIEMTIDDINAYSVVKFNNENPYDADTVHIEPQDDLPFEFSTFAQVNDSTASATWGFSNQQNKATFYSSASLVNNNPLIANDVSRALISVNFTLTETVDYAFSGSFKGILDPTETGLLHQQTIQALLGSDSERNPPSGYVYAGTSQSTSSGHLSLPKIGDVGFSSGGPLTPGAYSFSFIYDLDGGAGSGEIELTLSRHKENGNGNHVPDAGSTMSMLGIALGGLSFIRRS